MTVAGLISALAEVVNESLDAHFGFETRNPTMMTRPGRKHGQGHSKCILYARLTVR